MTGHVDHLAVYGSLAPGAVHHKQLHHIRGRWRTGSIEGVLVDAGWGARLGHRALTLRSGAPPIPVHVLTSPTLRSLWSELDGFEGDDYARIVTQALLESGETISVHVYTLAVTPPAL